MIEVILRKIIPNIHNFDNRGISMHLLLLLLLLLSISVRGDNEVQATPGKLLFDSKCSGVARISCEKGGG